MSKLLVYTCSSPPRLTYVTKVIFDNILNVDFELTTDKNSYLSYIGAKLNYSTTRLTEIEVFIPSGTILFEKNIAPIDITVERNEQLPFFFAIVKEKADFSFDFFGMCFYLLSRYEEYLPFEGDIHGRFSAKESLAYKNGFLRQPLINQWTERLRLLLNTRFRDVNISKPIYYFQPSYDIDMAWAFRHRGYRFWGGWIKDVWRRDWEMVNLRQKVIRGKTQDPFYAFDFLAQLHQKYKLNPIWFFLLGDEAKFDKNIHWKNKNLQGLIQKMASQFSVGIHPSYASNLNLSQLQEEIKRLEIIINQGVVKSRQHYLKLTFPTTYRNLSASSIQVDYTLGFADDIGFRGSIATPFPWYDIEKEGATSLILHPFQIMEVTLKNYLQLSPEEALREVQKIITLTKSVGGTFTSLWHNSSFSPSHGWADWSLLYEEILKEAVSSDLSY